ncbi:Alpha-L-rhamnosidase rgxB [Pseudocercospora fuligena]|uniref:Alpha-L-rhamnosidase rgxB n=1 Tax=Pseudocercospora fuligena TaxID=685502 RepID=A0A8H6VJW2_9PEZI|nr:Alpha-L-rhamnosidase rgxB [Pseudocercospora fuligena]
MSRFLARALALSNVQQAPLHERGSSGLALQADPTVGSGVAPPIQTPSTQWEPDRYDPYVCEYLGQNGCWFPSEVQEGPPYMGDEFPKRSKTCIVPAGGDPDGDDAPQILEAFRVCGNDGHIVFDNTTYYIGTIMNTTGLKDVDVEVKGTLLWDTNIPYWLANSMPIGFQNQTAAWHLGGENLHFYGHGYGTLNGNGDTWYKFNDGVSNRHGRPHALLITNTKNAVIEGLRFIKSQMWTMTVARSEKVLLQDIYVNNSAPDSSPRSNVNTDGADTVYANNITFLRWTTDNGDDAISPKQNSTNIYIANCTFVNGMGIAVGSIGQYPGQIEVIENITAVDIRCINSGYGARIKTWTGETKGYPPNGGGGGIGHAKNLTFKNFDLDNVNVAWALAQCTNYEGQQGGCDTSKFQISDIHWGNAQGSLKGDRVATLQCSAAAPCYNIELFNNYLWALDQDIQATSYLCEAVENTIGFNCTGACDGQCPHD